MSLDFIKFKRLHIGAILPTRSHHDDAGLDLYALADERVDSGRVTIVDTGWAVEIPTGYVGLVHPRSGLAFKHGITVVNAPGTVDSGYRGEIKVALTTLDWYVYEMLDRHPDPYSYSVAAGERIAQLVIQKVEMPVPLEVKELADAERGASGFGSTGK